MDPPLRSLHPKRPKLKILHAERLATSLPATASALASLPGEFSRLFDLAACAVRAEGLDLDDVVLERWLVCRRGLGEEIRLVAEPLSDLAKLADAVQHAVCGASQEPQAIVTAIEVLVLVDLQV